MLIVDDGALEDVRTRVPIVCLRSVLDKLTRPRARAPSCLLSDMPLSDDVASDYEQRRLSNIARNAAALVALGLDPLRLTTPAVGRHAPLPAEVRRQRMLRAAQHRRRSVRIASLEAAHGAPSYQEDQDYAGRKRQRRGGRGSSSRIEDEAGADGAVGNDSGDDMDGGARSLSQQQRRRKPRAARGRQTALHCATIAGAATGKRSCRLMEVGHYIDCVPTTRRRRGR
jgi:hypothetical protein